MVERAVLPASAVDINAVFHALAHQVRREMLGRLSEHDLTVGELAQPLQMTLAAASKHIKVLERVGLVSQTMAGRQRVCHLQPFPLAPAFNWLRFYEHFWDERLHALESLFTSKTSSTTKGNE
jgi:DNA-binding transcriptional ArsR family regulator